MNDPFSRNSQPLTDALLQLDRAISMAEANVAAAQQAGLPDAADLAMRLPYLTQRARTFLANVPDMSQPQRWGEARRLLEQARAFGPFFAPYLDLGRRIAAHKQAVADQEARQKAAAEAAQRARLEQDAVQAADLARRRQSMLRQVYADMQLQRGAGFDDADWQDALRSVGSILVAQETRLAAASASLRAARYDEAQAQLDQALGELQAALDLAQRARVAAGTRARGATRHMPMLDPADAIVGSPSVPLAPPAPRVVTPQTAQFSTLLLIETRTGTLFRCDGRATIVGRGLDAPVAAADTYIDLSRACDPGEAEELGVSRRHAELQRQGLGFVVRDVGSTNGTRVRHPGQSTWQPLVPQQWMLLQEGDVLQFGLLECSVSFS
jgi:hypothetical protein